MQSGILDNRDVLVTHLQPSIGDQSGVVDSRRSFNHLAHCDSNDLALFVQQRGTARTRRNRTEGGVLFLVALMIWLN